MSTSLTQRDRNDRRKRRRTVTSCTECHRRKQKCDRHHPCCNCVRRERQDLCQYNSVPESDQPKLSTSDHIDMSRIGNSTNVIHSTSPDGSSTEHVSSEIERSLQGFGYSSQDTYNSISLLRATEIYQGERTHSLADSFPMDKLTSQNSAYRRYRELVRRLPPQAFINALIQTFFALVNWQYDLLDKALFQEQLKAWRQVPYSDLQANSAAVAPEILVFPALLLQVLAQALLFHSPHDETISGLMIVADMTFHDLGSEYSDIGADILVVLGKKAITTATVQAGLLRASFLKNTGKIVEAWHTLGSTIRDAQEIGLHTGRSKDVKCLSVTEKERQSLNAVGQKTWLVLHIWDAHMAVVLGRPMATNFQPDTLADSLRDDERLRELFSHWQSENEQPRPFDIIVAGYVVAYRYFQDIHHLEHHDTTLHGNLTVEHLHATIISNMKLLPSWCRLDDPSVRFDEADGCQWLATAREGLHSLIHLVLLTLHRPHIFSRPNSRIEALEAGSSILRAQERIFQRSELHHRRLFTSVYASFDAIVLVAAICLAFPGEYRDRRAVYIEAIEKGIQRLDAVGRSNHMARSAHGVASSLYGHLIHRLSIFEGVEGARNSPSSSEQTVLNEYGKPFDPALPELSFDTISPPRPTHDLFYDHLTSAQVSAFDMSSQRSPRDSIVEDITGSWDFEGAFSDASFWGILNEFHPDTAE